MLELQNIQAGYRKGHWILDGIILTVEKGETLGVIGKNGSGKSTLAKAIMNMAPQREGQILFNGNNITRLSTPEIAKQRIGYFLQGGAIFPNLSVMDNLVFAGREQKKHWFTKRLKQIKSYISFLQDDNILNLKASY
nr:ATP-binding cassette domain-containing protein [Bacteroidota bacterium]